MPLEASASSKSPKAHCKGLNEFHAVVLESLCNHRLPRTDLNYD